MQAMDKAWRALGVRLRNVLVSDRGPLKVSEEHACISCLGCQPGYKVLAHPLVQGKSSLLSSDGKGMPTHTSAVLQSV